MDLRRKIIRKKKKARPTPETITTKKKRRLGWEDKKNGKMMINVGNKRLQSKDTDKNGTEQDIKMAKPGQERRPG